MKSEDAMVRKGSRRSVGDSSPAASGTLFRSGRRRRGERGATIVLTLFGLTSALLAVALGIDVAHFYLVKTELQHAADASALAAASALNSSASGIRNAVTRAREVMNRGNFNREIITVASEDVKFSVNIDDGYMSQASAELNPANIRFVRVTTTPLPVRVYFATPVLGWTVNLTATATAGQSVPLNVICGYLPIYVVDYGTPISPGNLYTFRSAPSGGPAPGNYQVLSSAGNGGKDISEGLAGGSSGCAQAGQEYAIDTAPGEKAGPVRKGINARFDDYQGTNMSPAEYPPDTNIKNNITYAQYRDGTSVQAPSNAGVAGRRIVIIPIVKLEEIDSGRNVVKFNRFGVFFLRSKVSNGSGGDLVAEYITDRISVAQGSYDPNGGAGNAQITTPLLY